MSEGTGPDVRSPADAVEAPTGLQGADRETPPAAPAAPPAPAVAQAERLLDGVADLPVAERVAVLDAVHRHLQDALATVDEA